jgi:SPX domain protein involved in polyphosphate accumulation
MPQTFNRFELKYIVSLATAERIRHRLARMVHPDPSDGTGRGYAVHSVYFDSPGLGFFWEKVEGLRVRRKVRLRRYGTGEDGFVEIKQRVDRTVQKRRSRMPRSQLRALCHRGGAKLLAGMPDLDPVLSEVATMMERFRLRPMMMVTYRRQANFGNDDPGLRITFDQRVRYSPAHLDLERIPERARYLVPPNVAIMELKFNNRFPRWLRTLVHTEQLELIRLSKYCTAVDKTYFNHQLT